MAAPRGFWLGAAATAAAAALLFAPVAAGPARWLLGNFQSEAATHAPVLAAAVEGLTVHGPFVLAEHPLHPEEVNGAMYEPITTLLLWPTYTLAGGGASGFALAWNAWHLLVLYGTALGAWIWARAWLGEARDPEGWGAGLAMALASASLFLHLSPEVGRTEATNYPLYALHAGLLFRAVRRGGALAWLAAAASVLPVIWAGGYAGVFFAVAEPLVALWALSGAPNRRRALGGLVGVAVAAGAAAAPLFWALQAHPYVGLAARAGGDVGRSVALPVLLGQTENLLRELAGYEVAPFVGYVTLVAAVLAVLRVRGALWPLAVGLLLCAVAAGPRPTWGGTVAWGPAALLGALPSPFSVVRVWARIVGFAIPVFAVGAAGLVAGLPRRRAAALGVLVAALALGEVARHRVGSAWTLEPSASVTALREAGQHPISLPLDGLARARRWLEPPDRPDPWKVMPDHLIFRYFQDALPNDPELFRKTVDARYDVCELLADAVSLRDLGFTHLVLREEALPHDGKGIAVRALKAVFGAPREDGVWPVPEEVPASCAAEGAPPAVITLGAEGRNAGGGGPLSAEERERVRSERRAERDRIRAERLQEKQSR